MQRGVWVNLGSGDNILPDFVNVDCRHKFTFDENGIAECINANLTEPWPWEDSTVDFILAKDIIEHLPDKIFTMNEIYRVLKPGGVVRIEVPTTDGRGSFQDPTHLSFWNRNSFFYFADGDSHRERFGTDYGITARFKVLSEKEEMLVDNVSKLTIQLETVKS